MKVHLLFGFLGSGKTTLAKHLLAQRGTAVRTAVIVNEFGEVGIDGDILRGTNIDVVELNSGCLCCTLRGSLMLAVEELRDKAKVQRVIVEATGVAQPSELLESLAESPDNGLEIGPLVTVVDSAKFTRLEAMLGDFYLEQIENADIVVANKLDLVSPEQLDAATRRLRELNPQAELIFAEQGRVAPERLFGEAGSELLQRVRAEFVEAAAEHDHAHGEERGAQRPDGHHRHHQGNGHDHHGHGQGHDHHGHGHDHSRHDHGHQGHQHAAPAETFVAVAASGGKRASVERFFRTLPDDVWRAKGFIHVDGCPTLVQYSLGQLELTPADNAQDAVVFIGRGMDRAGIESGLALATR